MEEQNLGRRAWDNPSDSDALDWDGDEDESFAPDLVPGRIERRGEGRVFQGFRGSGILGAAGSSLGKRVVDNPKNTPRVKPSSTTTAESSATTSAPALAAAKTTAVNSAALRSASRAAAAASSSSARAAASSSLKAAAAASSSKAAAASSSSAAAAQASASSASAAMASQSSASAASASAASASSAAASPLPTTGSTSLTDYWSGSREFSQHARLGSLLTSHLTSQSGPVLFPSAPLPSHSLSILILGEPSDYLDALHSLTSPPIQSSADLWIPSSACTSAACAPHTKYDPSASSTSFAMTNKTLSITYGDGSTTTGPVYTDTVSLGGLTAVGQTLGAATGLSSDWQDDPMDGLMGMGYKSLSQMGANPFFQTVSSPSAPPR